MIATRPGVNKHFLIGWGISFPGWCDSLDPWPGYAHRWPERAPWWHPPTAGAIHLPGPGPGSLVHSVQGVRSCCGKCGKNAFFVSYCFSRNYKSLRETLRGAAGNLRVNLSLQVVVCKSVKYHLRKKRVKNQVTARAPARATRTRIYRRAFVACGVILSAARVPVAIGFFLWPSSARLNSLAPGQNRRAVFLRYPAPLRYA